MSATTDPAPITLTKAQALHCAEGLVRLQREGVERSMAPHLTGEGRLQLRQHVESLRALEADLRKAAAL